MVPVSTPCKFTFSGVPEDLKNDRQPRHSSLFHMLRMVLLYILQTASWAVDAK